jgi:hypothetical protein
LFVVLWGGHKLWYRTPAVDPATADLARGRYDLHEERSAADGGYEKGGKGWVASGVELCCVLTVMEGEKERARESEWSKKMEDGMGWSGAAAGGGGRNPPMSADKKSQ